MSDYFPKEIILQILHKLPINSLLRFTCVSNTWHSFITNPSFISNHLTLTISSNTTTNTHLLLFRLCIDRSEHYSLRFDNQQLAPYMPFDFPFISSSPFFRILGSINGIICLMDICSYNFILWNPLIKKSVTLPKPSVSFSSHDPYEAFIGFGFDSKTNDYKVFRTIHLRSYQDEEEEKQEAFIEVELYSLNINSWKSITYVAPKYEFNGHDMQAFVNGMVHWVVFKRMRDGGFRNLVLGFDMGDEVFHEIKLPESLANLNPMDMSIRRYGDSSIAVLKKDFDVRPAQCHIWVMKEYGVVGSWTKLLSIKQQGISLPKVMGFRKSGEVLLKKNFRNFVSCDPQNQGVKDLGLGDDARYTFVDAYVESLVLLDNANAVSYANAAIDVIEVESDDSVGASDAIDDSNDASNDTSDGGSDASDDEIDTVDASDALSG